MQKTAADKVAEIIATTPPDQLRALIDEPYSRQDAKMAMTVGFCDKLAEYGLTPSDMNAMMIKRAQGNAAASAAGGAIGGGAKLISGVTIASVIAAALAGNMTGKMHHSVERRINKMDDPENVRLREKARRLALQRDELGEDLASRPTQSTASTPAATAQKQDVVQLLD